MKTLLLTSTIFLTFIACSKPPILPFSSYNVSSMLNDSIWFATGQALEQLDPLPSPCVSHRFDLFIKTDIPYRHPMSKNFPNNPITGCIGECRPSQHLSIFNIPIKKGKYRIDDLSACGMPFGDYHYAWVGYSGGLVMPFYLNNSRRAWVKVKRYDPKTRIIEGRFEGTFVDSIGQEARFERGAFKLFLQQRIKQDSE